MQRAAIGGQDDPPNFGWRSAVYSLADQLFFAGANFVLAVLLARWLSVPSFGIFSICYSAFLLAAAIHTAFVSEPLLVMGAKQDDASFFSYLGTVARTHVLPSALGWTILIGVGAFGILPPAREQAAAWVAIVAAAPTILTLWLFRRALYVARRPDWAAAASLSYFGALLGLLLLVRLLDVVTVVSAIAAIGMASAIVGAALYGVLLTPHTREAIRGERVSDIAIRHWEYGRWAAAAAVVNWLPGNVYYMVGSIETAAAFRILMTLTAPLININTALGFVLLPRLARGAALFGARGMSVVASAGSLLAGLAVLYFIPIIIFSAQIFEVLFDGRYSELGIYLPAIALTQVLNGLITAILLILRSEENTKAVFNIFLLSASVSMVVGIPLTYRFEIVGIVSSLVIVAFVTALSAIFFSRRSR